MFRKFFESLKRPPGTVDPALFPEDDYPICCLECGYTLVEANNGSCPECGQPFDRAVLLVELYVHGRRPKTDRIHLWSNRLERCATVVGVCLFVFLILFFSLARYWPNGFANLPRAWFTYAIALSILAMLAMPAAMMMGTLTLPSRDKQWAVLQAMRQTNDD